MDKRTMIAFIRLLHLKKLKNLVISFLFILLLIGKVSGQNITGVEYFFDTDPGFGNGTAYTVTPASNIPNLNISADISTLTDGFHRFFVRAKDDSGRWGLTHLHPFYKVSLPPSGPELVKVEYFFNTDPGFGNGHDVPVTPAHHFSNLNFAADLTGLTTGFHFLFVRTKDAGGSWSTIVYQPFVISPLPDAIPDLTAAEYFIDTDPGFGNGTSVALSPATHIPNLNFTVDIQALPPGFHQLMVRVKDANGKWSHTFNQVFVKAPIPPTLPDIVKAEYYLDHDPGFGNGTDVPLTPSLNINDLNFNVDLSLLPNGFHTLGVRVKDASGNWSMVYYYTFYKEVFSPALSDVVAVEYFFDNDPGYDNGQSVGITPGPNKVVSWAIGINGLSNGFHRLFVRVKDSNGKWSHTAMHAFYKETLPPQPANLSRLEYFFDNDPGFGQASEVLIPADTNNISVAWEIDIASLSNGFHKLFVRTKDENGKWSLTNFQPFYKQIIYDTLPDIVKAEYFYDTDPGFGNGINVPVTPAPNIPFLVWSLDLSSISFGQHQLFVRVKDLYGKWSLASHDTIFYYLDSLPTASLSGPLEVCIYDTATFEVTLTGTAPWTVIYNDGFEVDTAQNIMVSPFFFNVLPQISGAKTAQIIKVQDAYYTGLYTGIPIEYYVHPDPDPAGTLYGNNNVCKGTNNVQYWIYGIANAVSYEWQVPAGAVISYNYNVNWIYVDFGQGSQSGYVRVRGVNECGYGQWAELYVNLHDLPVVNAGPDMFIAYGDTAFLNAVVTGGTEPFSYSWYPYWVVSQSNIPNPYAVLTTTTSFTVYVSDVMGCSGSDELTINVGPQGGTTITGTLRYDNTSHSPLSYSTVFLKQGSTIISQTNTGATGNYTFTAVPAGEYTLTGGSTKPWGGVNSIDGLLILKDFVGAIPLSGLRKLAADVNGNGTNNATDALMCANRFVEIITSFSVGDWIFEKIPLTVTGSGSVNMDVKGLCFGDVDGSNNLIGKTQPTVSLANERSLEASASGRMDLPVLVDRDLVIGAFSLVIDVPPGFLVNNVKTASDNNEKLVYNLLGQELRIAWYDLEALTLKAGDPLIYLDVSYLTIPKHPWTLNEISVLADKDGKMYSQTRLIIPKLQAGDDGFELGMNYPNPFNKISNIPFSIPADGKVRFSILNLLGDEVLLLYDGDMKSGPHTLKLEANKLSPGIYHYRLVAEAANKRFEKTRKLIITR